MIALELNPLLCRPGQNLRQRRASTTSGPAAGINLLAAVGLSQRLLTSGLAGLSKSATLPLFPLDLGLRHCPSLPQVDEIIDVPDPRLRPLAVVLAVDLWDIVFVEDFDEWAQDLNVPVAIASGVRLRHHLAEGTLSKFALLLRLLLFAQFPQLAGPSFGVLFHKFKSAINSPFSLCSGGPGLLFGPDLCKEGVPLLRQLLRQILLSGKPLGIAPRLAFMVLSEGFVLFQNVFGGHVPNEFSPVNLRLVLSFLRGRFG